MSQAHPFPSFRLPGRQALALWALTFLLLLLPLASQAQEAIGRIILTRGDVSAVDPTGASRPLARGSEFFVDETILTGEDASVRLRFSDASVVTLEAESQFMVNAYSFDGEGGSDDTLVMSMVRGGLRTISGSIGSAAGDTYEMNTPLASIGIRGTEYGVRVTANGRTFVIVFDGGISLTPAGGGAPVNLGIGGTSDMAVAEDALNIVELDSLPPELQAIIDAIVESISDEELDALPSPEDAVELQLQVQLQLQLLQRFDADGNPVTDLVATANLGGVLVDANGNALAANDPEALAQARRQVVTTVSNVDPTLFDDTTKQSVSPH